jgi:uncharacterized protein YciI
MLYAITVDKHDAASFSDAAKAGLALLRDGGRLILAGAHPCVDSSDPGSAGFEGVMVIAEFETREAALAWAEQIYPGDALQVRPFKRMKF